MNFFVENAWIIAALPLWVFLIIVFGQNLAVYENRKISTLLTVGATGIGLIFSSFILAWSLAHTGATYEHNFIWLRAGDINLSVGWLIDNLSAMMLMVVTSVSILIQIYSYNYMHDDEGFHRFFAYLALFNFSMLGLVLSTNLFQIYIFWELVGVSSYLLIGFWYRRPSAADAAKKAFIMNRIGDFGLLIGIIAFLFFSLNWWATNNEVYLSFTSLAPAAEQVLKAAGPVIFGLIAFAIFLGPVAKSAQFPLHTWLPDAMEGPTPISALIHAATMVAAGVYLIARAYPIFELSPTIMNIIAWTGAITAFITATIAITQVDLKRVLAYSTCSQLGYMVLAMGVGAYSAGLFHLMTHAYFKAMLFLCSGAVIHGLTDQQDMRYMGGLRKHMPVVAYTYLIGTLAISGIFLSGFWSKDEIFIGIAEHNKWLLFIIALVIAGMTSFYMFRSYFMTFEGEYRGHAHPHKVSPIMYVPLIILAIPSAIIGFVLSGKLHGIMSFDQFISPIHRVAGHPEGLFIPIISLLVALIGFTIAAVLYWDRVKIKIDLDKLTAKLRPAYNLSFNKWYIDDAYYAFVRSAFVPISRLMSWFDKNIIDGIVNFTAYVTSSIGSILRLLQNGNVETYATILFGGITLITISLLVQWLF
ncbi:MAG: NADH-quinone oxidoreductase subunit L [Candidatus Melainabacteria bacterium RIFOXYA12_FULL_32_12]|nr:MAG: NADH-quinone oxidoreductase subunit L [Candidatus Melainabacteria bacterium RIFOXYA2_FULL_32_9]OGI31068.1 MAG: NADH-quinone oxidoreductase subunit L [Candidatus Melainabacteria bacterium RIFOXYA12_FULL_32_12]